MASVIDPRLPIIPAKGVVYDDKETNKNDQLPEIVEVVSTDDVEVDYVFEEVETPDDQLDPPSGITVVSQTVKVATAGIQTVDIVVEIADVYGAAEYERRDAV